MKKISLALSVLIATTGLFSCGEKKDDKFPGYEKLEEGLYVKYFNRVEGSKAIGYGDILTLSMTYSTDTDSLLFNSADIGQPFKLRADTSMYVGDFIGSLVNLREGDSASILVKADSFFINTARMPEPPAFIDSTTMLDFILDITKVESKEEVEAAQAAAQAAQAAASAEAVQKEVEDRNQYLTANNITETPTSTGLIFISEKKGTGKQAVAGKKVRVAYAGQFLDGKYFDTSYEDIAKAQGVHNPSRNYEPYTFTLGNREVIPGWDEAIAMMKEGGKARIIVPSTLAYGPSDPRSPIPPYATLIFDVELVEVID